MNSRAAQNHRFFPAVSRLACLFTLLGCFAFAQTSNTSLSGTVKDQQGSVIPNATIVLTNVATATVRTQKTSQEGHYSFDLLPPGDYKLEVQAATFRRQMLQDIHVLVANANSLDVHLEVGTLAETVEVSAQSSQVMVDTQDASLGNNFISQQITQLPLESRNVLSLLTLQPGVTKDGYVAGGRADQSNVTLDGVDINEAYSNAIGPAQTDITVPNAEKGPVLRLNSEAVEEFRVATLNSGAGGGRSSGAQIALVTKTGTNAWHGAAFESNRNTIFTANDWFNNHAGIARPTLIRNTYGGAVGGPIVKSKAFFFYSYEARNDASQTPVLAANQNPVPFASLGQGNLNFHLCSGSAGKYDCSNPGNIVTLHPSDFAQIFPDIQGLNQAALQTLSAAAAKYPANDTTIGDGMNVSGFRFNASTPVRLHSHSAKVDFNLSSNQTLFVRANVQYDKWGGVPAYPDTPAPDEWDHPWGFAVGHTWTIHNNLVNNFRYGYTRQSFTKGGDLFHNDIDFRFVYFPTNELNSLSRVTPVNNWVDDLSWVKGAHTIQFGANVT